MNVIDHIRESHDLTRDELELILTTDNIPCAICVYGAG